MRDFKDMVGVGIDLFSCLWKLSRFISCNSVKAPLELKNYSGPLRGLMSIISIGGSSQTSCQCSFTYSVKCSIVSVMC